ncbi:MAG TPA: DUF6587 family protein [Paraburkholderia sp.]|uniref:DUF6587 family protein n=1 Tax=Paraburkholderia sp. TaxID=1926495 RepID=UPI002C0D2A77|nr:DUF6587 family protein [Paraburkholderia sp.]HTR08596.1 DUF6587 family protein [Paraburkholderia sp.]
MSLWCQYGVVALAVTASLIFMMRKLAPQFAMGCQVAVASALTRDGRGPVSRWIGRGILPPTHRSGDCGDGCSACNRCGTSDTRSFPDVQPLEFRPRPAERAACSQERA